MAKKLISREWCAFTNDYRCKYICDTDADFETLPACCTGSSALSVESRTVKMVNASGNWVDLGDNDELSEEEKAKIADEVLNDALGGEY